MLSGPTTRAVAKNFFLDGTLVNLDHGQRLTFSGIGVYSPRLFEGVTEKCFSLVPLLHKAMINHQVTGQHYNGVWVDVGTPERLSSLNQALLGG